MVNSVKKVNDNITNNKNIFNALCTTEESSDIVIYDSDDDWNFSSPKDDTEKNKINNNPDETTKTFNIYPTTKKHESNDGYTEVSNLMNKNKKYKLRPIKLMNTQKREKYRQLLCRNILLNGPCPYEDKCKYAHSIDEQVLDDIYDRAYKVVQNKMDLTKLKIRQEPDLYKILLKLCNVCTECEKGKCPGGYNCRNGACRKKYTICKQDLQYGKCDLGCGKIHLSQFGFEPYYQNIIAKKKPKIPEQITNGILLDKKFFEDSEENYHLLKNGLSVDERYGFGNITFYTSIFDVDVE